MSMISESKATENNELMVVDERPVPKKILEEDEYLERMAKIIRRDFFPDVEFQDSPGRSSTNLDGTESSFRTPGTNRTQFSTSSSKTRAEACSLSLNQYLDKYTSEDNAYFDKLQRKEMRKHRAKYPWLYRDPSSHNKLVNDQLKLPSIQEQASIELRADSTKMIGWHHKAQNAVFYAPNATDATKKSKTVVNYNSNKYINESPFKQPLLPRQTPKPKSYRLKDKIGIDGKLLDGSETPMINGYSFIPPPESPRLVDEESSAKSHTNRFYIPNESPRDELAHRVYEAKVAKSIRTPKIGQSGTPRNKTPSIREAFSKFSRPKG